MAPAVKRLLPPDSSSGAASSISTEAPFSRAASAAQYAALPPPTTMTSQSFMLSACPRSAAMGLRPAARIAHERLDFGELAGIKAFALLCNGEHVPPGGEMVMRDAHIGEQLQPFGKDVVEEHDECVVAFHAGFAQRIDEIDL